MNATSRSVSLFFVFLISAMLFWLTLGDIEKQKQEEAKKTLSSPRNIYLITASGLRADHLNCYGYQPIQTPAIDFLAYDGVRFLSTFSTSPDSLTAHLSLLTGLLPVRDTLLPALHPLYFQKKIPFSAPFITLPLILSQKGYRTAAILSDPELRYPSFFMDHFESVFTGDRETFSWEPGYDPGEVTSLAMHWITENLDRPHLLLVNYSEPTAPFDPPPPFHLHYQEHPYDGEIAGLDEQLGLLMNHLKKTGLYENSIIVLTAPYGEKVKNPEQRLGAAEKEILNVPLVFVAPGLLPRQTTYASLTSLVDIVPTVFQLLGEKLPVRTDGHALFQKGSNLEVAHEKIRGLTTLSFFYNPAPTFFEWNGKQITLASPPIPDLPYDPVSVIRQAYRLIHQKKAFLAADLLTSLEIDKSRNAPLLAFYAELLSASGQKEKALEIMESAYRLSKSPLLLPPLASLFLQTGNVKEAEKKMILYERNNRMSYYDYTIMGRILYEKGNHKEAITCLDHALRQNGNFAPAYFYRGKVLIRTQKPELAGKAKKMMELAFQPSSF